MFCYIFASLLFAFSAGVILYDAHRQTVPPLGTLRVVERTEFNRIDASENVGIPILRDEYIKVELRDGTTRRYREWYPNFAKAKETLLSQQPIRIWVSSSDHYGNIYQIESSGRVLASYDAVGRRIQRNARVITWMAFAMALLIVPYCLWKAWRIAKDRPRR
jgi:hypothetical protein